jgi:hypothetical protein
MLSQPPDEFPRIRFIGNLVNEGSPFLLKCSRDAL